MQEEEKFIKRVWEKYEIEKKKNLKDEFYEKNQFIESNKRLMIRTVASFILAVVVTASAIGGVYAVVQNSSEEKKIKQDVSDRDYNENVNYMYDRDKNMTYVENDSIYYGLIETYDEYIEYKENKVWNNIPEMAEEDFNSYFLVIVAGDTTDRIGLYVSEINVTEDTLEIGVKRNNEENTVVFAKIEKEKYREKVTAKIIYKEPSMTGYTNIDEIPKNYTIEDAIEDECVVIKDNKFVTDENQLKDFIKKAEKGENLSIRVAVFFDDDLMIVDIEHKNRKYIGCSFNLRYSWDKDFEGLKYYIDGDTINIDKTRLDKNKEMSNDTYVIINKTNGDELEICRIKIN